MGNVANSTDALVEEASKALLEVDLRVLRDLSEGFREGLALLDEARVSLVNALADNRVEEVELLQTRLIVLKALAALRPFTPQAGSRSERLLRIIGAFKGVADCFYEHEVQVVPAGESEPGETATPRSVALAEFSLELFEARLQQLLETIRDMGGLEDTEGEAAPSQAPPAEGKLLGPSIAYLHVIHRYAIPGCVYGAQARRENPYLAARALRAGCARLQGMLSSRYGIQEPLERLAKLEGRLTAFIEEVRTAGAPIEEPEGWLRRFRANRLDAIRSMGQELTDIEQALRDRSQEREQ
jgi:hypothetical protein